MAKSTGEIVAYAQNFGQAVIDSMVYEANKLLQEQDDLIAEHALEMENSNFARRSALLAETSFFVRQIRGICDAEIAKVESWIADRLAWAEKQHDSYRKRHLIEELTITRKRLLVELEARVTQAEVDAETANNRLSAQLDEITQNLATVSADWASQLSSVVDYSVTKVQSGIGARLAVVFARA